MNEFIFFNSVLVPNVFAPRLADGDIGVATQASFFHIAVGNAQILQRQFKRLQIIVGLLGRAQFRFGDDLQQRRARAVIIDQTAVGALVMDQLARVLFQMRAFDIDLPLLAIRARHPHVPVIGDRFIILRNLISLGQVRIIIIFPVELDDGIDLTIQGDGDLQGILQRHLVQNGQCSPATRGIPDTFACSVRGRTRWRSRKNLRART